MIRFCPYQLFFIPIAFSFETFTIENDVCVPTIETTTQIEKVCLASFPPATLSTRLWLWRSLLAKGRKKIAHFLMCTHTASSRIACNRFRRAVWISTGRAIVLGNLGNPIDLHLLPPAARPAAHGSRNSGKCTNAVHSCMGEIKRARNIKKHVLGFLLHKNKNRTVGLQPMNANIWSCMCVWLSLWTSSKFRWHRRNTEKAQQKAKL